MKCVYNLKNATHDRFKYALPGYAWAMRLIKLVTRQAQPLFYVRHQQRSINPAREADYNNERRREVAFYEQRLNNLTLQQLGVMYGHQIGRPPEQADPNQTFGKYWAYLQTRRDQLSRKMLYHWVVQNEWRTWLRLYLHFRE
jgi:hypothetical protein